MRKTTVLFFQGSSFVNLITTMHFSMYVLLFCCKGVLFMCYPCYCYCVLLFFFVLGKLIVCVKIKAESCITCPVNSNHMIVTLNVHTMCYVIVRELSLNHCWVKIKHQIGTFYQSNSITEIVELMNTASTCVVCIELFLINCCNGEV